MPESGIGKMKSAVRMYQLPGWTTVVIWSDGSTTLYNDVELGCNWFKMSNDAFFNLYGFNFNPHEVPGLYEYCRKKVYPNDENM